MHWKKMKNMIIALMVTLGAAGIPAEVMAQATTGSPNNAMESPWMVQSNPAVTQHDVTYRNYKFRDGEVLRSMRIHYQTLGSPHKDAQGHVDNAILMLHWTGASGRALTSSPYMNALYGPGKPLDTKKWYLIIPDNVGLGQSSKPSDGLRMKFPRYGYSDLVDIQHKLVAQTLSIDHLHAVIGMSMGGMNAWQWAENYPSYMDGVMPVVSLPVPVNGRNLLWRQMVMDSIRSDPGWYGRNYKSEPKGWIDGFKILRMMIDGVPHLNATINSRDDAERFLSSASDQALSGDANDMIYSLASSRDYDPSASLRKIKAYVYALNFSDDEFNPDVLNILEDSMKSVSSGTYAVQPGTPASFGHLTMAHPELWSSHVDLFMHAIAAHR